MQPTQGISLEILALETKEECITGPRGQLLYKLILSKLGDVADKPNA